MSAGESKWYYDLTTGEVTQGPESGFENRLGPYDSREAAEKALETAAQRNAQADAADDADDDWGQGAKW